MIAIISCGKRKSPYAKQAHQLYEGVYFKMLLKNALRLVELPHIYIISSRYGLVNSKQIIEPYSQTITANTWSIAGKYGTEAGMVVGVSFSMADLQKQAATIKTEQAIYLGSRHYPSMLHKVFPNLVTPIQNMTRAGFDTRMAMQGALLTSWIDNFLRREKHEHYA